MLNLGGSRHDAVYFPADQASFGADFFVRIGAAMEFGWRR
jgi:hypothetical protein